MSQLARNATMTGIGVKTWSWTASPTATITGAAAVGRVWLG